MKIFGIVITILIIAISVIAYLTVQTFMRQSAIDGCLQAGRLEFTNDAGLLANTPDAYWYNDCMEKKGYLGADLYK